MTDLRTAAQQALEALEYGQHTLKQVSENQWESRDELAMQALRVALAEPVQQGCDHCNQPLYAAIKCRVCGRVTGPVQRLPLTEEEILSLFRTAGSPTAFARAIERAHKIT